jgi:hypothetical protein
MILINYNKDYYNINNKDNFLKNNLQKIIKLFRKWIKFLKFLKIKYNNFCKKLIIAII